MAPIVSQDAFSIEHLYTRQPGLDWYCFKDDGTWWSPRPVTWGVLDVMGVSVRKFHYEMPAEFPHQAYPLSLSAIYLVILLSAPLFDLRKTDLEVNRQWVSNKWVVNGKWVANEQKVNGKEKELDIHTCLGISAVWTQACVEPYPKAKRTTARIRCWSPTQLLIGRFVA